MKTSQLFTTPEKIEFLKLRNLINTDYVKKPLTDEVINLSYNFISPNVRLLHLIAKELELFTKYQNNRTNHNWNIFIEFNKKVKSVQKSI